MNKSQKKITFISALICLIFLFAEQSNNGWWFSLFIFVPLTVLIYIILALAFDILNSLMEWINKS